MNGFLWSIFIRHVSWSAVISAELTFITVDICKKFSHSVCFLSIFGFLFIVSIAVTVYAKLVCWDLEYGTARF